jgi:hypothetical protein
MIRSHLGLGLAPRPIAASPAITPPVPAATAIHRATLAVPRLTCVVGRSHGGPKAGSTIGGRCQPSRSNDRAIMMRIEEPIPTAASQVKTRDRAPSGMCDPSGLAYAGHIDT